MDAYSGNRDVRDHVFGLLGIISEQTHKDPYSSHLLMTVGDPDRILDGGVSKRMLTPERLYSRMGIGSIPDGMPDLSVYNHETVELLLRGIDKRIGKGDIDGSLVVNENGLITPGSFLIRADTNDPNLVAEEGAGRTAMRYVSRIVPGASGFMMSDCGGVTEYRDGKVFRADNPMDSEDRLVVPVTLSLPEEADEQALSPASSQ